MKKGKEGMQMDEFYEPIEYETERCKVRVFKPKLDETERERRQKNLEKATADFMRSVIKAKEGNAVI